MDTSKPRPDLLGAGRVPESSRRILANLEHGPRAATTRPPRASAWTIDGWTIGLGLLVLTMCVVAWLMHEETITPNTFKAHRSSTGAAAPLARETTSLPVIPAATEPHEARPAGEQAASIVNDPATHTSLNAPAHAEIATAPGIATDKANTPALGPASSTQATVRVDATLSRLPAVVAAKPSMTKPGNALPARPSQATESARGKTAPTTADTDVTLLTALVAHAGKPVSVTPERSRDVVERKEGDKTVDLLARCKQLGLIEGMLCRSRICSGRWEADPACSAPAQ